MREVGLGAATLRAWERRYGLLKPERSPGGHRLYSKQDIEMLKWLVERQNEGLSISSAVEMWKSLPNGQLHPPRLEITSGVAMLDQLRDQWISACQIFDDQAANRTLDQAFAVASPETICIEVLQKGLARIGEAWYSRSISVQQEHFASAIAIRRVNSLMAVATPPTRTGHILAACPPGEEHGFALLLVTYLLKRSGWDVIYLGSNVPLNDLDATIQSTHPSIILSSAQTLISAASLRQMSEFLVTQSVPLAFGGGIFNRVPKTVQAISGYYLGTEMSILPQLVEKLVAAPQLSLKAQPISLEYSRVLRKFHENKSLIIRDAATEMQSKPVDPAHVEIANTNLTRMIASALILGDISLLDYSSSWLNLLLKNYGLSTSLALHFYSAYQTAVDHYLGNEGTIIMNWLSKLQPAE